MAVELRRRQLLAGLASAAALTALPWPSQSPAGAASVVPRPELSLARVAAAGGRYFGAAARIDQIDGDDDLREALLRDCSCLTPEVHLKWDALEWTRGRFSFGPADKLVAFALRHGLKVHGHTLLWDESTPGWAKEALVSEKDWSVIRRYFGSVITRYGRAIDQWDVVNEPIDTVQGRDGLRANVFLAAFGPNYIRQALEEARLLAPHARLMINEYGFEYDNDVERDRRYHFLKLVEKLRNSGAPIDGVGIQAHLDLSKGTLKRSIIGGFLSELADMGLHIAISELDVKESDLTGPLRARDARVADEVMRYLDIALSQPAVRGVTTWGLSDRHSWLQDGISTNSVALSVSGATERSLNRGLPYDAGLAPKPMHRSLHAAFSAQAVGLRS